MKHSVIRIIKLCILITLTFALGACTLGFEDAASVSFAIPREAFDRARNITLDSEDNTELHVLSIIRGVETETHYDTLSMETLNTRNATLTFQKMPVGENISIEVNLFKADGTWLYYGTTPSFTVKGGTNEIDMTLTAFNNDVDGTNIPCTANYYVSFLGYSVGVNGTNGTAGLFLDYNGFYSLATLDNCISLGKWRGSPVRSGTVYLTEYLYSPVEQPNYTHTQSISTTNETVISTSLKEYKLSIDNGGNFAFTMQSGIDITGCLSN